MDHSRRSSGTTFSDDFDEFDLLLEDDDDDVAATPAPAGSRPGRTPAPRRGMGAGAAADESRPAGPGGRPRLRVTPDWNRVIAVLLVGVVALFLLWLLVSTISSSRREGAYKDYFAATRTIAETSSKQGKELSAILTDPAKGSTAQRIAEIEGLSTRVEDLARQADDLEAPEQLAPADEWFRTSLQYRANGVDAVQRALGNSIDAKDQEAAAQAVSSALSRLVASDVVYADSFVVTSRAVLREDGVEGDVTVEESVFAVDPDMYGPKAVESMLDRIAGGTASPTEGGSPAPAACADGTTCGGEIGQVAMSPTGTALTPGGLTEVAGGEDIAFEVPFTNQGEVQLTGVPVKIVLRGEESDPVTLTGVVDLVDPGQTATATVSLDEPPNFGETLEWSATVGPIAGEKTADNNSSSGQLVFNLA